MNYTHFTGLDGFVWFIGVVEDNNDPDKLGRVKVRAYGHHSKSLNDIPLELLPWATVMGSTLDTSMQGQGSFRKLEPGTWIVGFFLDAEERQQPVVMGTIKGKPNAAPNKDIGFNDPSEINPQTKKWSGHGTDKDNNNMTTETQFIESDVNRLAKNETDLSHTVLTTKEEGRTKEVAIANSDEKFDEPASTYAAVYPDNNVLETSSGHIVEYDDSVGTERIHEYHKTGTFYEIDKAGIKTTRIVANNYTIVAGDDNVHIKGICNLTIDSHCHTYIKGNWKVQVNGNKYETIHGNNTITVHKNQSETCNVNFTQSVGGTKGTTVTGSVTETYNSSKSESVSSSVSESYGGDQITTVSGDVEIEGTNIHLNKNK